jgi:hypothetical protein
MATEHLRQWLGILRRQYGAAGWTDRIWPDWMDEASRPITGSPASGPLH